jgi:hypothetical protein
MKRIKKGRILEESSPLPVIASESGRPVVRAPAAYWPALALLAEAVGAAFGTLR